MHNRHEFLQCGRAQTTQPSDHPQKRCVSSQYSQLLCKTPKGKPQLYSFTYGLLASSTQIWVRGPQPSNVPKGTFKRILPIKFKGTFKRILPNKFKGTFKRILPIKFKPEPSTSE